MKRLLGFFMAASVATNLAGADLRIGMIGLDTSHVIAFTKLLNDPSQKDHVPGGRVVAAVKGGSPDVESSASRVEGFTRQLRDEFAVNIVPDIPELCAQVDVVMIESVDGRPHLQQAREVIKAGKRLFIDKPVAGSLKDAIEIFRLAKANNVPVFSSSSYRFYESLVEVQRAEVGVKKTVVSYGPAHTEPHHPDLFWYAVHPMEALYTVIGTGCKTVTRVAAPDCDIVTGVWNDGKIGTLVGLRGGATPHKVMVFGSKGVAEQKGSGNYAPLLREIMKFFQTGKPPVQAEETIEMFAFMEAADESKRRGGCPVEIADVLKKHSGN